jgi:hypothetical protein
MIESIRHLVDVLAGNRNAARSKERLDPILHPGCILHDHRVRANELPQLPEAADVLVDRRLERPGSQSFRQRECIALVVLLCGWLRSPRHDHPLDVRRQDLDEPRALRSFFDAQVNRSGLLLQKLDQGRSVRLHDVRAKPFALSVDDCGRAARGVHVEPDVFLHRRSPCLWVRFASTTQRSLASSEDATLLLPRAPYRLELRTPPPDDACSFR